MASKQGEGMDKERYERGLKVRREVLGEAHVGRSMAAQDDYNKALQDMIIEWGWGSAWAAGGLPRRERSIMNLGMLAALGRWHEFEVHCNGALNNGVTPEELKLALWQTVIYCGVPTASQAFQHAARVLKERGLKPA